MQKYLIESKQLDERCAFRFALQRPKESTRYCPLPDETREILVRLRASLKHQWIADSTAVLSHSGLRFGELAQLTRFDADLRRELILIRDETFDPNGTKTTKGGFSRAVPMHPVVKEIILRRLKGKNDLLFQGPRGGTLRSDTYGRNLRKLALEPLAEKFPHPRFQTITAHCFRHFFASLCAANKVSEQTTMDWMGHKTSSMARVYYRSNHRAAVKMIQQFDSFTEAPTVDGISHNNPKKETSDTDTAK